MMNVKASFSSNFSRYYNLAPREEQERAFPPSSPHSAEAHWFIYDKSLAWEWADLPKNIKIIG